MRPEHRDGYGRWMKLQLVITVEQIQFTEYDCPLKSCMSSSSVGMLWRSRMIALLGSRISMNKRIVFFFYIVLCFEFNIVDSEDSARRGFLLGNSTETCSRFVIEPLND